MTDKIPSPMFNNEGRIKQSLAGLANLLITEDANNDSYYRNYTAEDVMNALHIFGCIANGYGIKRGIINSEAKALEVGENLAKAVEMMTGIQTKTYYHTNKK